MITTPELSGTGFGVEPAQHVFRRRRVGADAREDEADQDRMALRTHDELGLLSGEGCVTDWGLVEQAERLRSGWA